MGRPVNKRYFGPDQSTAAGEQAAASYSTNASGVITSVSVGTEGSGYADSFSVDITGGPDGEATINFTVVDGAVTGAAIGSQEGDFVGNEQAVATYSVVDNAMDTVTISNGGAGYDDGFTVEVSGGIDGEATISFDVDDGVITGATITSQSGDFGDDATGEEIDLPVPTATVTDESITMPAPAGGETDGFQILGSAWLPDGEEPVDVFIVRQRSSRKFLVASVADPSLTGVCMTVDGAPTAAGQLHIPVTIEEGADQSARIIHNRTVRTFEPARFPWSPDGGDTGLGTDQV